jgi:UDP-2,3-diacylglucosamine hydrolase
MDHLFLSDVHLGAFSDEEERDTEHSLLSLIDYCMQNRIQIHVLGDLFDYWMEYPGHIPKHGQRVLNAFAEYNKQVAPATYITGNHDNWTRGYFQKIGFRVLHDYLELTLNDNRVFLHHGDGLLDPNHGMERPMLHRFLRDPHFIDLYQTLLPPVLGLKIMKWFSDMSRRRSLYEPERLNRWSRTFLENTGIDTVLCGHDHIPRVETFSFGTYINLGTFFRHRTVAIYRHTNPGFDLVVWDDQNRTLSTLNTLQTESEHEQ